MRQTAVEFLIEGIKNLTGLNIADDEPIIEQAKEKFYRQITNAYESGIFDGFNRKSKDYYNETFKEQEKDIEF